MAQDLIVLEVAALAGAHLARPLRFAAAAMYSLVLPAHSARAGLVRALAGDERCERGAIRFLGEDIGEQPANRPAAEPRVCFVPPDGMLLSALNVWENIELGATIHRPERGRDLAWSVSAMFRQLGLDSSLAARLPRDLTLLQRRLVGFVRAVAMAPELVVLDSLVDDLDGDERVRARRLFDVFRRWCPFRTLLHVGAQAIAGLDAFGVRRVTVEMGGDA